jgi:hypothetical protein
VTCVFLNKTKAVHARPHLEDFLRRYPTLDVLENTDPDDIKETYFKTLGLFGRSKMLVKMAGQLLHDPPLLDKPRQKTYKNPGYASEVAHLAGIGDYASDAWRLFCKKPFYASHGTTIEEEWKTLDPQDKDLKRYVERKRRQERTTRQVDDVTIKMARVRLSIVSRSRPAPNDRSTLLGSGDHALRIPQRVIDDAITHSAPSFSSPCKRRVCRVSTTAS